MALAGALAVPALGQDIPGASDPSLISRYQGSRLVAWKDEGFVSAELPATYDRDGGHWKKSLTVEGERQFRVYLAPPGRSGLEVQRNYEAALLAAGGTRLLACTGAPCYLQASDIRSDYVTWLSAPSWSSQRADPAFHIINEGNELNHAIFSITRAGRMSYVTVLTVQGAREGTGTVIDIVSRKPMDTGKVSVVDAQAIGQGLKAEGRVAVYGVSFDTGKAEIRPESAPQFAEMARLLKSQPTLKVFIVGHTDNVGQLDANLALSQRRAEAIVAALTRDYGIAASRLQARGVANFAPVAANDSEAGRARNRRVELVVQ
jgi:outer membrane protein OmpA-like peptidoglycan-associated protein